MTNRLNRLRLAALLALLAPFSATAQPGCEYQFQDVEQPLQAMIASSEWTPYDDRASFGYHNDVLWIRCPVPEGVSYFSVQNPVQKRFDLHFLDRTGKRIAHAESGRTRPASSQQVRAPEFVQELPKQARWVYIEDNASGPKNYPLAFLTPGEMAERNAAIATIHGMYYGIFLVFVVAGAVVAVLLRRAVYAFYAVYATSLALFLANKDGFGRAYLWPDWGPFLEYWPIICLSATVLGFSQFAIRFLNAATHHPLLTRALNISQVLFIVVLLWRLTTDHYVSVLLEPYMVVGVCGLFLTIGVLRARSGSRAARIFLWGNGMMAAGVVTFALLSLGVLQPSLPITFAVHLGSLAEVVVFATTLAIAARAAEQRGLQERHKTLELSRRVRQLQSATELAEEHRQLQRSVHAAQKQRTLGQMAGGFAHEFNNILASVLGFAELAQQRMGNAFEVNRYLEEIRQAGDRGSELVRQLVQYGRGSPHRPRDIDLAATVAEACSLLRSSLPPSLSINLSVDAQHPPPKRVYLDEQSLQQLVVNVCLNASEAMSSRGVIDINVSSKTVTDVACTSCMERFSGEFTAIEVTDNGPGISGSAHQLFEPFHTTKGVGSGSGLGLSVVHGIVHECGGHVQLGNQVRGGLRVAMYLREEMPHEHAPEQARILIIEQSPSVASYLKSLLDGESYDVTTSAQATDALEQFMATPGAFDLVITDAELPHGSGLELAQDLRALRPDLPIIMTTHTADDLTTTEAIRNGIQAVFAKPIEAELMVSKIRALLNARGASA